VFLALLHEVRICGRHQRKEAQPEGELGRGRRPVDRDELCRVALELLDNRGRHLPTRL
jgi:hypothetical protein